MNTRFNLSQFKAIYSDAWKRRALTIAFELRDGPGRFLFMMFFSPEDDEAQDRLFILLGRTQVLLKLKMYGSHRNGDFFIYIGFHDQEAIRRELDIQGGSNAFNLGDFFEKLNRQIPQNLPLHNTVETIRSVKASFETNSELRSLIDDAAKIYLIGPRRLPENKQPREKTLRKLYLHVKASSQAIEDFVAYLKAANCTVAWTDDPAYANNDILQMMNCDA